MIKFFVWVLLAIVALPGLGQGLPQGKWTSDHEPRLSDKEINKLRAKKESISSVWINYGRFIRNSVNVPGSYFRNYLYPDSTVQTNFSSGMGYVWKHSIGQIIDPQAGLWGDYGVLSTGNYSPYTLDSLGIVYRYNRFNDVNDYLIVQIYETSSLTMIENSTWQSKASYAYAAYDYNNRKGSSANYREIRYDLGQEDTAIVNQGLLYLDINSREFTGPIAVVVTYFPGQEANVGDTIDYINYPDVKNKVNAFLAYDYTDDLPYIDVGNFNMGQMVITSVRYNENTNGWNGKYIPGTSYASGGRIYHYDMWARITYDEESAGLSTIHASGGVYPNPAEHTLTLEIPNEEFIEYTIIGTHGREVQTGCARQRTIDISSLAPGMYLIRSKHGGGFEYHRFVKK